MSYFHVADIMTTCANLGQNIDPEVGWREIYFLDRGVLRLDFPEN